MNNKRALVIGGGIFGVCASIELSKNGIETYLFEKNSRLMQEATSVNQNRFHFGYHYPRSVATAKQCREGIDSFKEYFNAALINPRENYYAISRDGSKTSFSKYIKFCKELGLPHDEKYPSENILNRSEISGCVVVNEQLIDLDKLKKIAESLLRKNNVKVFLNREFTGVDSQDFQIIVNATYSSFNYVNRMLNLPTRKFRYDICNVPVIKLPKNLSKIGITIMDGDFYSILPYGRTPYHLFWSVQGSTIRSEDIYPHQAKSHKIANYRDDTYIPLLKHAKLIDVLRTIKILAYDVEYSDERLTDLISYGNGKFAILSAKINTCVSTARKLVNVIKNQ